MSNILVWMSPESGHVLPTIKIARDLTRRGHSVIYQTRGQIREELENLGFKTTGFFESASVDAEASLFKPLNSAASQYIAFFRGHSWRRHSQLLRDELFRGLVSTDADLFLIDGVFDRIFKLKMHEILPRKCKVIRIHTHLPYAPFTQEEFLPERGPVVFLSPQEFELEKLIHPQAIYAEGAPFEGPGGAELPPLEPGKSLIYCSFGSQIERYPTIANTLRTISAAAGLLPHCQFVINAGILAEIFKELERDNLRLYSSVPQVRLLSHSSVMILHGGFGSIKDCIYQKVPMLVLPQRWDQPTNGVRVQSHGLGLALEREQTTPFSVASAVISLLTEPSFKNKLSRMRRIFLDRDQEETAACACERVLDQQVARNVQQPYVMA